VGTLWIVDRGCCYRPVASSSSQRLCPYERGTLWAPSIKFQLFCHLSSFIHYGDLYSAPSTLLLRSAPDPCTAKRLTSAPSAKEGHHLLLPLMLRKSVHSSLYWWLLFFKTFDIIDTIIDRRRERFWPASFLSGAIKGASNYNHSERGVLATVSTCFAFGVSCQATLTHLTSYLDIINIIVMLHL